MGAADDAARLASDAGWDEDSYAVTISDGAGGQMPIYFQTTGVTEEGDIDAALEGDERRAARDYSSPAPGVRAVNNEGVPVPLSTLIRPDWDPGDYNYNCQVGDECYPFLLQNDTATLVPIVVESPMPRVWGTGNEENPDGVYYDTTGPSIGRVLNDQEAAAFQDNLRTFVSDEAEAALAGESLTWLSEGDERSAMIQEGGLPMGDIDVSSFARLTRFKEQCFLLANVREFATFNQRLDPAYEWAGK